MRTFFIIVASFLIACILQMIPLPTWVAWLRPEWLLLVLIFWAIYLPERVGLNIAFMLGILMDLLMGTLLGENALAFVFIAYFMMRFSRRIELFPLWQQSVIMLLFMLIFQSYKFIIWRLLYGEGVEPLYWVSALITAFLWPWVYSVLSRFQLHYKVY
jgi:rod shape-determining protein MreD